MSSSNATFSPIIVVSHCESRKQILFYIYRYLEGKLKFSGGKNQNFELQNQHL